MKPTTLISCILSLIGGLWMLIAGIMIYRGVRSMPHASWGMWHLIWDRSIMEHFGFWWPWFGILTGSIVISSTILLYVAPKNQRSLGTIILVTSILNLFCGSGGLLASAWGITGGIVALLPKTTLR